MILKKVLWLWVHDLYYSSFHPSCDLLSSFACSMILRAFLDGGSAQIDILYFDDAVLIEFGFAANERSDCIMVPEVYELWRTRLDNFHHCAVWTSCVRQRSLQLITKQVYVLFSV
jgi:hypothetical protein